MSIRETVERFAHDNGYSILVMARVSLFNVLRQIINMSSTYKVYALYNYIVLVALAFMSLIIHQRFHIRMELCYSDYPAEGAPGAAV